MRSTAITYPRITTEMFVRAVELLNVGAVGYLLNTNMVERVEQAERDARIAVGHADYEAFEAEFMRIVESEAARKIIEEGL